MVPLRPFRITFIGRYTEGSTGIVRSIFLSLHELGHAVQEINVDQDRRLAENPLARFGGNGPIFINWEIIKDSVIGFQPDLILLCAGGLTFRESDLKEIKRHAVVLGVTLSDPDVYPTVSAYSRQFHFHATNSLLALQRYRDAGHHNVVHLPFGIDSRFFVPRPVHPPFQCDVAVIGHATEERLPLAKRLYKEFNVMFHGRNWPWRTSGPVHGEDWFRAAYSTRFLVNFPRTRSGYTNVKIGIFEGTATGRLVFTEYFDEMGRYFEYDKEIVGYRDADDLVTKIRYYLDHPDEAEAIAKAGQLRCAREHTWANRIASLLEYIHRNQPRLTPWPAAKGRPVFAGQVSVAVDGRKQKKRKKKEKTKKKRSARKD